MVVSVVVTMVEVLVMVSPRFRTICSEVVAVVVIKPAAPVKSPKIYSNCVETVFGGGEISSKTLKLHLFNICFPRLWTFRDSDRSPECQRNEWPELLRHHFGYGCCGLLSFWCKRIILKCWLKNLCWIHNSTWCFHSWNLPLQSRLTSPHMVRNVSGFRSKCSVYPHFWGQTDKLRAKPPSSKVVVSGPDLRKWSTNLTKTPNLRPATYSSESQRNRSGVRRIGQGNDLQKVEDMSIMKNCYSE